MERTLLPWYVLFAPLVAAVLITVVMRRSKKLSSFLSCAAVVVSFGGACLIFARKDVSAVALNWIDFPGIFTVPLGFALDNLSRMMLVLVSGIGALIHIYSLGYMRDDEGKSRYFAALSLFMFAMLGIVLANNFVMLFIFWELVGFTSYVLIGHWFYRDPAAAAAKKAFITTRIGDFGFMVGILMVWMATGSVVFAEIAPRMSILAGHPVFLTTTALLLFCGAVGKSAQFPLHVWLPDAMEGPTPVSALIHAATMVTAGVFMVTRTEPLFALVPEVLTLIAWVGAFTALLAATMACVEGDIKRVLAYSTVSQLGYMMAAAGAGAAPAGFLHLLTHGLFKALLFLAAGAVIHAVGTNDIFRMGGLFRAMPQTAIVFVVGTLALAGVPPLAGFFSKEAVLGGVWEARLTGPFLMLALTVLLTALYMFRVVFIAFFGRAHAAAHRHEAPWLMRGPLWLLAALTVLVGVRLALGGAEGHEETPAWLAPLAVGLAVSGFVLAWAMYQRGAIDPARVASVLTPLDYLARRRYGLDAIYAGLYRGFILGFSGLIGWIDRYLVDGILNVLTALTLRAGDNLRHLQSGRAQDYVYGVAFG